MKLASGVALQVGRAFMDTEPERLFFAATKEDGIANQPTLSDGHWVLWGPSLSRRAALGSGSLPLLPVLEECIKMARAAGVQGSWIWSGGTLQAGPNPQDMPPFADVLPHEDSVYVECSAKFVELRLGRDGKAAEFRCVQLLLEQKDGNFQRFSRGDANAPPALSELAYPLSPEQRAWLQTTLQGFGPCMNAAIWLALVGLGARVWAQVSTSRPDAVPDASMIEASATQCRITTQQSPLLITCEDLTVCGFIMPVRD